MSDIIQFQCGSCGRGIRAKANRASALVKCPGCSKPVTVPKGTVSLPKTPEDQEEGLIRPNELLKMKQKRPNSSPSPFPSSSKMDDTEVSFEENTKIHLKPTQKKSASSPSLESPVSPDNTYIAGVDDPKKLKKIPVKTPIPLKKNLKAPETYTGPEFEPPPEPVDKEPETSEMEETFTELTPKKLKTSLKQPDTYVGKEEKTPETTFDDDPETTFEKDPETSLDMEDTFTGLTPKKLVRPSMKKDPLANTTVGNATEVPVPNLPLEEKLNLQMTAEQKPAKKPTARTVKISDIPEEYPKPSTTRNPVYAPRGEVLTLTDFIMAYFPILGVFYGVYLLVIERFAQRGRFILVRSLTVTTISLILFLIPLLWYLRGLNSLYQCQNNLRALGCGILQYSVMFGDYNYPQASGSAFFTSIQKYQIISNHQYFFCPGTSAYSYAGENQKVDPSEIGYLGRRNTQNDFLIPRIPENENEIVIGADKTHPSDVHASQVNVLFLDNHVKAYPAFHEELGGKRNPFGGILEVLAE